MKKLTGSVSVLFFILAGIVIPAAVSGQGISVLGEMISRGKVFIQSSSGQWVSAGRTYPILQNTAVRTENGTASFSFREGSRVDLSKNSSAVVDGTPSQYSLYVSKGVVAFNIAGPASLYITTPSGSASIGSRNSLVQKVSYETSGRTLGMVSVSDKGTEFRSLSGKILVNLSSSESRVVATGDALSIDTQGRHKVYKVQAIVKIGRDVDYKISTGDILEVKTPSVEGYYRVDSNGDITLPNNRVFKVKDLTPAEVEALLVKSLGTDPTSTFVYVVEDKDIALAGAGGGGAAAAYPPGEVAAAWAVGMAELYTTAVTIIATDTFRGSGNGPLVPASPSGFRAR